MPRRKRQRKQDLVFDERYRIEQRRRQHDLLRFSIQSLELRAVTR
jgi:hypothetical protein